MANLCSIALFATVIAFAVNEISGMAYLSKPPIEPQGLFRGIQRPHDSGGAVSEAESHRGKASTKV